MSIEPIRIRELREPKKKKKSLAPLIAGAFIFVVVIAWICLSPGPEARRQLEYDALFEHTIVEFEADDNPAKVGLTFYAVVEGDPSEKELREVLGYLHDVAKRTEQYRARGDRVGHVSVFLYRSWEDYSDPWKPPIAILHMKTNANEGKIEITIK